MGFITDTLFGSTTGPSVSQKSTLTEGQRGLLDQLTSLLQGQLGTGVEAYGDTMTAPASELQTKSWSAINNLLEQAGGNTGADTAINRILSGTTSIPETVTPQKYDIGEFDKSAIQDWYKNALVQPALQSWQEDVVPAINESFISQNAASSGAAPRAIAESAEDLMSGLNSQLANTLYGEKQAYDTRKYDAGMDYVNKLFGADTLASGQQFQAGQSDLDRILNVPGMESTDLNNLLNTIMTGTTAGATQRGITSEGLNEDYQKWLSEQGYNNPWINQLLGGALSTGAFENVVYPGSQQSGLFQDVLGPLISAKLSSGSGWSDLFSW
jgi:hypothetical protein